MFRQEIRNRNFLGKNNRENILINQYHYILKLFYKKQVKIIYLSTLFGFKFMLLKLFKNRFLKYKTKRYLLQSLKI